MVRSLPKDTLPYPQGNARRSGSGAGLDLVFSVRSCIQAPLWLRPCCSVLQQVGIFAALADYLWRTLSACRVDTRVDATSVRSCIRAPLWLRPCCSVGHAILPAAAFQAALSPAAQI